MACFADPAARHCHHEAAGVKRPFLPTQLAQTHNLTAAQHPLLHPWPQPGARPGTLLPCNRRSLPKGIHVIQQAEPVLGKLAMKLLQSSLLSDPGLANGISRILMLCLLQHYLLG